MTGQTLTDRRLYARAFQAGIKDHIEIGDFAIVGAQAGVHRPIPEKGQVLGTPAYPARGQRKVYQLTLRLPEFYHELRVLTKKVAQMAPEDVTREEPESDVDA